MDRVVYIVTTTHIDPIDIKVFDSLEKAEDYAKIAPRMLLEELGLYEEHLEDIHCSIHEYIVN